MTTFDELRDRIWEEKHAQEGDLIERLSELSAFERGRCQGSIWAYENMLNIMRGIEKWGELE